MLKEKYLRIRNASAGICAPLTTEDHVVQPVVFVSPPKWHLAHTTWFFEQFVLVPNNKSYKIFNKDYNFLFNSYYESVGNRVLRTDRGNITRPGVAEVLQYRSYVDEAMMNLMSTELQPEVMNIIELGLNHEQQHQELLYTDIKYILGHNPLLPAYTTMPNIKSNLRKENYVEVREGIYEIGYTGNGFCFDNEKGVHKIFLHAFHYMDRLITNAEYLEFMDAGGYSNPLLWLAEGWDWVKMNNIKSPMYWYYMDNDWHHYTLGGQKKIDHYAPVTHISFYEADAYARWAGKRLLTEFEWEVACKLKHAGIPGEANFADQGILEPQSSSHDQLFGDVWEWTNSAYLPYPWYKQEKGALGEYNGKFMINQMVLRGGSCVTPRDHIRSTYRNFFHADERWQFTGIRLGENIQ